jgi:hypothetical protein
MDLVNIGRSRRFLRERPIRVNLFDRPRLVCDLICLETEQTEKRRGLGTSDSLYLIIEGKARLVTGPQVEEMEEQDAALIPPGVDHTIENIGPGRLTVMVLVTPKPSRAAEVRMPVQGRPRGRSFRYEDEAPRPRSDREEPERPARPRRGFDGPPPRDRRPPRPTVNRQPRGEKEEEGPVWFPKPKPAWRPRGRPPASTGRGGRPSGPPRGRGGPPTGPRGRSERPEGERGRPSSGGRGRPEGSGGSAGGPRGRSGPPRGGPPRGGRGTGPSSPDRRGGSRGSQPPRQNGRRAPGRNAPRTSGRRQSRES